MDLPREYISYSQVRLYQTCPRKYYYVYIKNLAVPINDKIFLGVVFHKVIEEYFKKKIESAEPTVERSGEMFNRTFESLQNNQPINWENTIQETRRRGNAFVSYFVRKVAPAIKPLMVEKELWADLPGLDIKLKGVLDLVETDFSITDFKTTTAKWSKSRIKNTYLQVVIYRYLFEQSFGDVISRLQFKIIYAKNTAPIKSQEISIKPKDVDFNYAKMLDIIAYVVNNIKQGVFYKNENYFCGFCEYKDRCRSGEEPECEPSAPATVTPETNGRNPLN
ncbi:MAG: RecB family exonuclease [Candidatus Omnitrophota bacterium]